MNADTELAALLRRYGLNGVGKALARYLLTRPAPPRMLWSDARQWWGRIFATAAVEACQGNYGRAARYAGIHRNTVTRNVGRQRIRRG